MTNISTQLEAAEPFENQWASRPLSVMGYPSEKSKPSPWHFQRKPIEESVTML